MNNKKSEAKTHPAFNSKSLPPSKTKEVTSKSQHAEKNSKSKDPSPSQKSEIKSGLKRIKNQEFE